MRERSAVGTTLLVLSMLTGAVTHGWNAFRYPLYLTDEGIYTEQAWAVVREGRLSPYTYFYDHAPFGWLVMAGWARILPGGFNTFGNAINTGRALTVLVHVVCVFLLFEVVRRFSGSVAAAVLATFVFNFSPLAVYYQRQVLLDNLMVLWVLLALYLLARRDGRVVTIAASGLCFGLAMITKENALFLLPGFGYLLHRAIADRGNRRFSAGSWWFAATAPVLLYLLFAQLKNEVLPEKMDFNLATPPANHVSLAYTVWWQLHRTPGTNHGSALTQLLRSSWLAKDGWLLGAGALATFGAGYLAFRDRQWRVPMLTGALMAVGYGFYLTRSVVLDFYVLPLVPLLALNIGLVYGYLTRRMKSWGVVTLTAAIVAVALVDPGGYLVSYNDKHRLAVRDMYRLSLTQLQDEQVAWIRAHVPPDSRMIIDDDIWVALHDGRPSYPYAHSHWKAASDPDVRDKIFHSDWHNLNYVVLSNKMREAMEGNNGDQQESWMLDALDHHGDRVWQVSQGDVELEIVKINTS